MTPEPTREQLYIGAALSWDCSTVVHGRDNLLRIVKDDERSPIQHHLVLPGSVRGIRRFYSLMIECDLFGIIRGQVGTNGQGVVEVFASEGKAHPALEALARAH